LFIEEKIYSVFPMNFLESKNAEDN